MDAAREALELAHWRRTVAGLYATVRETSDPAIARQAWRAGRDALFRSHPQSPLAADDPLRRTGLPYWEYDPAWRFEVELVRADPETLDLSTGDDGVTTLVRIGAVELPIADGGRLDVWWLQQYGGGIFLPFRDGTAGSETYGAGRYLLDTAKGADLGRGSDKNSAENGAETSDEHSDADGDTLLLDFNFAYHPSCRYDPRWVCPLAPLGNRVDVRIEAGERL